MVHVLSICPYIYNGQELWTALAELKRRGHTFEVVSTRYLLHDEATGQRHRVKRLVSEVDIEEMDEVFDALMITSGDMTESAKYWEDVHVRALAAQTDLHGKPIGAICGAVPSVRVAARGKKVSFFPLIRVQHLLEDAGAIPQPVSVSRDANLVTAEYPMAAQTWVEEFCNLLEGKPQQHHPVDSGFRPGRRERRPIPEVERLKRLSQERGD